MKYFIVTFGCQQNHNDSQKIMQNLKSQKMLPAESIEKADYIVINTCMIRESAENRVYGLVNNLKALKEKKRVKIVVTGCMTGLMIRDKTGKFEKRVKSIMPEVDEFLPIEKIGSDYTPLRGDKTNASVTISNGCNNFCSYCIVPFTRGHEISRPYSQILEECAMLKNQGYKNITLLGQNVNSYGSDLISKEKGRKIIINGRTVKPTIVKHLGRFRIPTLFPQLLDQVAKMGFKKVDFLSSNPWDFSDDLISVIAKNKNISRLIHLPVQSGDDQVLKRMNRWYKAKEYLDLLRKIRRKIPKAKISTDIIVGFCGETENEFSNTVKLVKKADFDKAYLAMYSPRFNTISSRTMKDDVPHAVKEKRWKKLNRMINKKK